MLLDCVQGTQRVFGCGEYALLSTNALCMYVRHVRYDERAFSLAPIRVVNEQKTGEPMTRLLLPPLSSLSWVVVLHYALSMSWSDLDFIYAVIFVRLLYTPTERRNIGMYGTENTYYFSASTTKGTV